MKIRIKFFFLTKDFEKIKNLIVKNENALKYLDEKEIETLLDYAAVKQDFILFNTILLDMSKEKTEIKQALDDKDIKNYLPLFFSNLVFLYSIANMMSSDPQRYAEQINQIKHYILATPLTEISIYIHVLNGFYDEKMEDKILESNDSHFLANLLENSSLSATNRTLNKLIATNPTSKKISCIANSICKSDEKLNELKNVILNLQAPNNVKGRYLLAIYTGIKKIKKDESLKDSIILLNDFNTTKSLMEKLDDEETSIIIHHYFLSTNKDIIFTLACTTDCKETPLLINKVLYDNKENTLISLIMCVKENYLPLIFKQVLTNEKIALKLINDLYLLGSNRWMNIINYITEVNYDIISATKIKEMTSFMEKEETKASRKRSLT